MGQIPVRRRDHPDIDRCFIGSSDTTDHTLLQDSQELDLHRHTGVANLVEEDRPLVRYLEQTLPV